MRVFVPYIACCGLFVLVSSCAHTSAETPSDLTAAKITQSSAVGSAFIANALIANAPNSVAKASAKKASANKASAKKTSAKKAAERPQRQKKRVRLPTVSTPQTPKSARRALEMAFAAEAVGDLELAAAEFHAILATDFLTDAGRMQVYWHAALAHRVLGDLSGERAALEGYLLAASLIELTADEQFRTQQATGILLSMRSRP